MSHYTRVRTTLRDPQVLVEALADVGFAHVEQHAVAQPLVGYRGDLRAQAAEIIVRRKHVGPSSNDIGFAYQPNGTYEAIISEFDRRKFNQQWLNRLAHAYGRRATLHFATAHGYHVEEHAEAGQTRMVLRRYA